MSMFTSTIDYLLHQRNPVENNFARSLARLKASSNLDHLSVLDGDSGSVSKYVHMEAETGQQMISRNNYQKAITYMQFQEEAIKYANILYSEMASLALRATDPKMSQSEIDVLSAQFAELREIALDLNHATYSDNYLFEERAASTDFYDQASWDLYWKRIDNGLHKDITTPVNSWVESIYNSPIGNIDENTVQELPDGTGWQVTRDVIYNKGKVKILFNPGNRGEILQVIQGNPDGNHRVLFDSGDWKTKGEAYQFDYDAFEFSYAPDEITALTTPTDLENTSDDNEFFGSKNHGGNLWDATHIPYWQYHPMPPSEFWNQEDSNLDEDSRLKLWRAVPNRTNEQGLAWDDSDTNNLWQNGTYNWVRDESGYGLSLKDALIQATKINPAVRTPADLYKWIGQNSDFEESDKKSNDRFVLGERTAVYYLGNSLQFIAKHPNISNDDPTAASKYDFETANNYEVEILGNQTDLLDAQNAKIQYGHGQGAGFASEITFNVAKESGFDGNQAKLNFVVDDKFVQKSDRKGSEQWLRDAGHAGDIMLGNLKVWVAMQKGDDSIRGEYINTTTKSILGNSAANANNKSIEITSDGVKHYQGATDKIGTLTQASGTLTIPLKYELNYVTSDQAIINDHSTRFAGTPSMITILNGQFDYVASKASLLGIDIEVTGLDGAAGNSKTISVIVDDTLTSDTTSWDGNTLTVTLSQTIDDGFGGFNYTVSDLASLINGNANFSATYTGSDPLSALPADVITGSGESNQKYRLWNYTRTEIAKAINDYYDSNKDTAYFRDANESGNTRFAGLEATIQANEGSDEELIKYEESDWEGTITTSRKFQVTYDADEQDGFEGYKQQTVLDAFNDLGSTALFSNLDATDSSAFLNVNGGQREYTSYAVGTSGNASIHTEDNLNDWMGRDQEDVTYNEVVDYDNPANRKITIKLRGSDADPHEVARAYNAFINQSTLANINDTDAARRSTKLSAFMAPVVMDNSAKITAQTINWNATDPNNIIGKNGTGAEWIRTGQEGQIDTNPASENIAMSNNLTLRVLKGERSLGTESGRPIDNEDSFQLRFHYRPPEKEDLEEVGREDDLNVPIYALGLGLLRDDRKVEFDVGGLHIEAEAAGKYKLYIEEDTAQTEDVNFQEWGFNLRIRVKDLNVDVAKIIAEVNANSSRFSASGSGTLGITKGSSYEVEGHYGQAVAFSNAEGAQRVFENMTREIYGLAQQVDQLTQNMSKVTMSNDHVGRQIAIRKDIGPKVTEEVMQQETINLKQIEILRDYHMSLLHKVMRVNEDMVRMLVL